MAQGSKNVVLACAIGAGIGTLVAFEVSRMFWWVGLIVGFLIGYIGYDVRGAARAVPAAFRAVWAWENASYVLRGFFWFQLAIAMMAFWLATLFTSFGLLLRQVSTIQEFFLVDMIFIGGLTGISAVIWLTALLTRIDGECFSERDTVKSAKRAVYKFAPPIVIFWHLPRGVFFTLRAFARFARRFGWEFFLRVHSEERLICGFDAMVGAASGAAIGRLAHLTPVITTLVGAVCGGLLGFVNYEFVTKRWLEPKGYIPKRFA